MGMNLKSIILATALTPLLSIYIVEAHLSPSSLPDPTFHEICSQTEFSNECITSLITYTSGAVDGNQPSKLAYATSLKVIAEVKRLKKKARDFHVEKGLSLTLARHGQVLDSIVKAKKALRAHDYMTLKKELHIATDVVSDLMEDGHKSNLQDVTKTMSKVADNNLDILMNVVKPSLPQI